ncbi:MAG: ATP-binding SpoIIE family protein phosphatase [Verrucomicrobiales bacterium]
MDAHRALLEVARSLMRAGDSDELIYEILLRARDVMHCEVCSVLLPDRATGELVIRSTFGPRGMAGALRVPPGEGIAAEVFRTRLLNNIADARSDPRHYASVSTATGLVTRAMITIPLLDGEECLGVMQAINPRERGVFDGSDQEIFLTFGSFVSATLVRVQAHEAALREAAAKREFALAHEIQASFLPRPGESLDPFEVRAFYQPASEIGGDFYFWNRIDADRVLAGVGDVCGEGLAAALDMARCSTLIPTRVYLLRGIELAEWVSQLNDELCKLLHAGRFVAATFLLLDARKMRIDVVTAGQFPPRALVEGDWITLAGKPAPPLGISERVEFGCRTWPLGLAREWLLYSDGLLERKSAEGAYFGDEAFEKTLGSESAPIDRLALAWKRFGTGAASFQDDCTILWLRNTRPAPPARFSGHCSPAEIAETRQFIESWTSFAGFGDKDAGLIVLAIDEVLTNIYRHAYGECCGQVSGTVTLEAAALVITLEHHGRGIDASTVPPLCAASPEKAGGLGLGVVQAIFDEVKFETSAGASRIVLAKRLRL